jgi:hypothetical protein
MATLKGESLQARSTSQQAVFELAGSSFAHGTRGNVTPIESRGAIVSLTARAA